SNGLLMGAFLQPELLLQRLLAEARHVCSFPCPPEERPARIQALEAELDKLGYTEEALISKALDDGETVTRFRDAKPWHVLQVRIRTQEPQQTPAPRPRMEHELRAASAK